MLNNLFPGTVPFFGYFEKQNDILQEITVLLQQLLSLDKNLQNPVQKLAELEMDADKMQHKIIKEIAETFITPIDREDIYAISIAQEKVIDSFKGLGDRFCHGSFVHARLPAKKCIDDMYRMTIVVREILECIRDKKSPSVHMEAMHNLKDNCETLISDGLSELYDIDIKSLEQVRQIMVWSQLYDRIEHTLFLFSDLGDILEQAVLKYV